MDGKTDDAMMTFLVAAGGCTYQALAPKKWLTED